MTSAKLLIVLSVCLAISAIYEPLLSAVPSVTYPDGHPLARFSDWLVTIPGSVPNVRFSDAAAVNAESKKKKKKKKKSPKKKQKKHKPPPHRKKPPVRRRYPPIRRRSPIRKRYPPIRRRSPNRKKYPPIRRRSPIRKKYPPIRRRSPIRKKYPPRRRSPVRRSPVRRSPVRRFPPRRRSPVVKKKPPVGRGSVFNINSYGGNLGAVFAAACAKPGKSTIIISGNRSIKQAVLSGPCKGTVVFQIDGLITPGGWGSKKSSTWAFIEIRELSGFSIQGSGTIDGKGQNWWGKSGRPMLLYIIKCSNFGIRGITLKDSPFFNMHIVQSTNVYISGVTITAPATSPNTDGIHLAGSKHVVIESCTIGTGDDGVSIWDSSTDITVSDSSFVSGNGVSIGSLGGGKTPWSCVDSVTVKNLKLSNTKIGLRIKSFQGGKGAATKVTFSGITLNKVQYPLVLDQFYCHGSLLCEASKKSQNVVIAGVSFNDIKGTCSGKQGIFFRCASHGCTGVTLKNIAITSSTGQKLEPVVRDVYGFANQVSPSVAGIYSGRGSAPSLPKCV